MSNSVLMQWGPVCTFRVWPMNTSDYDHLTASDWAKKDILGAPVYREWTGEGDEELHIRGKLFPYYFAAAVGDPGEATLQMVDNMRKAGQVDLLIRGDGRQLGWYIIDRLSRAHKALGPDGIGREINFEAVFIRIPRPSPELYLSSLWQFLAPVGGAADNVAPEVAGAALNAGV